MDYREIIDEQISDTNNALRIQRIVKRRINVFMSTTTNINYIMDLSSIFGIEINQPNDILEYASNKLLEYIYNYHRFLFSDLMRTIPSNFKNAWHVYRRSLKNDEYQEYFN